MTHETTGWLRGGEMVFGGHTWTIQGDKTAKGLLLELPESLGVEDHQAGVDHQAQVLNGGRPKVLLDKVI